MAEHTSTPWKVEENCIGVYPISAKQGPLSVHPAKAFGEADAAFIVKATNHFDDLIACVRASLNMVDGDGSPPDWDFLRRTLKSAEAKDA
jgi:hypothetical protein